MNKKISNSISQFVRKTLSTISSSVTLKRRFSTISENMVFKLAEMAYLLSTCREEGKYIECRLALLTAINTVKITTGHFIRLSVPLSFDINILTKFAMTCNTKYTYVCIQQRAMDGEFEVIGYYVFNNEYERVSYLELNRGSIGEPFFNIRIKEPGMIASCIGPIEICQLKNGETYYSKPVVDLVAFGPFRSKLSQDALRIMDLAEESAGGVFCLSKNTCYDLAISLILDKMINLNHGGTLIIIGNDDLTSDNLKIKYSFESNKLLKSTVQEWQNNAVSSKKEDEIIVDGYREVEAVCSFVAQLSAVDGALVIRRNLELVGFGAEINTRERKDELQFFDIDLRRGGDFSEKGTRHRSACRYCYSNPNAVVFVVSQDGYLTGMTYYEGTVEYLKIGKRKVKKVIVSKQLSEF